jgi:hypothetical protein
MLLIKLAILGYWGGGGGLDLILQYYMRDQLKLMLIKYVAFLLGYLY